MISLYEILDRIDTLASMVQNETIYSVKNCLLLVLKDLSGMLTESIIQELEDLGEALKK